MVASDGELVVRLGANVALEIAPNRYWRSKVIEAVLARMPELAEPLRLSHPAEWLWAASRRQDDDLVPSVLASLADNKTDADLVNRVLLCVTELGSRSAIDMALAAAEDVLARPGDPPPALM